MKGSENYKSKFRTPLPIPSQEEQVAEFDSLEVARRSPFRVRVRSPSEKSGFSDKRTARFPHLIPLFILATFSKKVHAFFKSFR